MIARLAKALRVSADELLGIKPAAARSASVTAACYGDSRPSTASKRDQGALFCTVDAFLQVRRAS
jgi:hypothetical protein